MAPADEGVVRLTAEAASDEGWYLGGLKSVAKRLYDRAFSQLFAALRRLAPEISQADPASPTEQVAWGMGLLSPSHLPTGR